MDQESDIETPEDEVRDSVWMRWVKFVSIIVLATVLLGSLFGVSIHVVALFSAAKWTMDSSSGYRMRGTTKTDVDRSNKDTMHSLKIRFMIGSILGASCGVVYVVRCLIRNEDP
jgi:predicted MFS family arabinose efflux permease